MRTLCVLRQIRYTRMCSRDILMRGYPLNDFIISRGAEGPGREILQRPPSVRLSVCLSVTFSFRTVTQKRIDVFSRNFAGTCTKSWGCAV